MIKIESVHPLQYSKTPLMSACEEKIYPLIDTLLAQNVDINEHNSIGQTAIYYACYNRDLELMKKLLDKGADIDNIDKSSQTVLILAASLNHTETVDFLLQYNPSLYYSTTEGRDVFMWACKHNNCHMLQALLEHSSNTYEKNFDESGMSAFMYAVEHDNSHLIELLLHKNWSPCCTNSHSKNLFHHIAQNGKIQALKTLIEYPYLDSINQPDLRGKTSLFYAIDKGFQETACLLISNGAKVILNEYLKDILIPLSSQKIVYNHLISYLQLYEIEQYIHFIEKYIWTVDTSDMLSVLQCSRVKRLLDNELSIKAEDNKKTKI